MYLLVLPKNKREREREERGKSAGERGKGDRVIGGSLARAACNVIENLRCLNSKCQSDGNKYQINIADQCTSIYNTDIYNKYICVCVYVCVFVCVCVATKIKEICQ